MTPLETEAKLRVPSLEGWPERLVALGLAEVAPLQEERSTLWDSGVNLYSQGCALRVRRYAGGATLTWKGPRQHDPVLKIRPERETPVGDPDALEDILRALGFEAILSMVKHRAVYRGEDLVACLDETPFGAFVELEGPAERIRSAMETLGLTEAEAETRSYPTLFRAHGLA